MNDLNLDLNNLFYQVSKLLKEVRHKVVNNINQTMFYAYFEIGRMIVED